MKFSSYNFFFPYEADKHIAYNAITNSLALIDSEQLTLLKDINETSTLNSDSQFHNDLLRGGYIIDENIDELDLLRSQLFQARYWSAPSLCTNQ